MNSKKWTALVLFALAACVNLVGNWFEIPVMERVSKPVLMPLVLLNALLALEDSSAPRWLGKLLTFALCFHCAGDIFLMLPGFACFAAGLVCFFTGHVFYITLFSRKGVFRNASPGFLFAGNLLVIAVPIILVNVLDFEGPIKYAVLFYAYALLYVALSGLAGAVNRRSGMARPVFWLAFCGGLIFLFSDFLVAWRSLLGHTFPHMGFAIMFTYILAECLIVTSIVRSNK